MRPSGVYIGAAVGGALTVQFNHISDAAAFTLKATTMAERLAAVGAAVIVLVVSMAVAYRVFGKAFFNGFVVSSGTFLSFDIILLHWIFQLHRITSGPEADVLEPVFVVLGIAMVIAGSVLQRRFALR